MKGFNPGYQSVVKDDISRLFGEVNYLFIDDIKKLPRRMPDMYSTLTT